MTIAGAAAAALLVVALGGCSSLAYMAQAAGGHLSLLHKARPVAEWTADPATPGPLRQRLQLSQGMRDFASRELKLPDNDSYRRYADLGRSAAVWNVVATPELSLTLKTWCFPVMGCVGYRGYYQREAAQLMADQLKAEGDETLVYGVPAYSTLGWSNVVGGDPLLNTFLNWSEADLAQLIFHELAHQVAYAADDTMFNESFATAVERIGGRRWMALHATPAQQQAQARQVQRQQAFRDFTLAWRSELEAVLAAGGSDAERLQAKALLMTRKRAEYEQIKRQQWDGYNGFDAWVAQANNPALAIQAAYNELVPQFERLFERQGRDWLRFYAEVKRLADLPKAERRRLLEAGG